MHERKKISVIKSLRSISFVLSKLQSTLLSGIFRQFSFSVFSFALIERFKCGCAIPIPLEPIKSAYPTHNYCSAAHFPAISFIKYIYCHRQITNSLCINFTAQKKKIIETGEKCTANYSLGSFIRSEFFSHHDIAMQRQIPRH